MEKLNSVRRHFPRKNSSKKNKSRTFTHKYKNVVKLKLFLQKENVIFIFLFILFSSSILLYGVYVQCVYIPPNKCLREKNVWLKIFGGWDIDFIQLVMYTDCFVPGNYIIPSQQHQDLLPKSGVSWLLFVLHLLVSTVIVITK